MKNILKISLLLLGLMVQSAEAADPYPYYYAGDWQSTNRGLGDKITAKVTYLQPKTWSVEFSSTYQGQRFDARGTFELQSDKTILGTADIEGQSYVFRGFASTKEFRCNFTGGRYVGNFNMKRVK